MFSHFQFSITFSYSPFLFFISYSSFPNPRFPLHISRSPSFILHSPFLLLVTVIIKKWYNFEAWRMLHCWCVFYYCNNSANWDLSFHKMSYILISYFEILSAFPTLVHIWNSIFFFNFMELGNFVWVSWNWTTFLENSEQTFRRQA